MRFVQNMKHCSKVMNFAKKVSHTRGCFKWDYQVLIMFTLQREKTNSHKRNYDITTENVIAKVLNNSRGRDRGRVKVVVISL